jgi:hypothetical protein
VGEFGTATLVASTRGLESTSPGDVTYKVTEAVLSHLDHLRDIVAGHVKASLEAAAFNRSPVFAAPSETAECNTLIGVAQLLAK